MSYILSLIANPVQTSKVSMWWSSVTGPVPAVDWLFSNDLPHPHFVIAVIAIILVLRFLHVFSPPAKPEVTLNACSKNPIIKELISGIDILNHAYVPPKLWGRSGHIQTAAYGLLGHASLKRTADRRAGVKLLDGTTATFDIFEPIAQHPLGHDVTLVLTPGIANSSESNYIRTCVHYAQEHGYRCAVLNHVGALADVRLTGNRIFSYGGIDEITAMMNYLMENYLSTKFINIGFSMGGNITTQYILNMKDEIRHRVLLALSVGQGYSATVSGPMYHDWENGRRAYNYIITENMKRLLRRNYQEAVAPHIASGTIDEQRLWSATSIVAFDEYYSRRILGYSSVDDYYDSVSCLPLLKNLKTKMIFFNVEDDPIVPPSLWQPVKDFCAEQDDVAFILTKHGGHLGFLEGSSFAPHSVTWLDRFIVQLADQTVKLLYK